MILSGYFLGSVVERAFGIKLDEHIEKVVIVVVLLSLMPPFIEYLKSRREKRIKAKQRARGCRKRSWSVSKPRTTTCP